MQRFNAALFRDTFTLHDDPDLQPFQLLLPALFLLFLTPGIYTTRGNFFLNSNNNNNVEVWICFHTPQDHKA